MNPDGALVRAIRGPILLITIGSLFALDLQGNLEFRQTWPILLIAIGLMKLLEHLADRGKTTPGGAPQ